MSDALGGGRERRSSTRFPIEMWVEEFSAEAQVYRRAGNLSKGGLYLDQTIPLPLGTAVRLKFQLPGDDEMLVVSAQIVSTSVKETLGMGVKFTDLSATDQARIDTCVDRVLTPLSMQIVP